MRTPKGDVVVTAKAGSTFGKYRLNRVLGRGGMGEVHEAYDTSKDRTVALKILTEDLARDVEFRNRFQRESRVAAMLEEPHVIPIHDWGEIDGNLYIDMRLVRGKNLHDLLQRGPLEPARAVAIIRQVAAALDAAHDKRLIHRDVKPQNILITGADDFAYLIDFGIAEIRGDTGLTSSGKVIGSFSYIAPERFSDRPARPAADIYSLAGVLYESLTRQAPVKGSSIEQVIAAHISDPPPKPSMVNPRVPAALDDVIARGMAKEPDDRYSSPGALGRAAERALGSVAPRRLDPESAVPTQAASAHAAPTAAAWQAAQPHSPAQPQAAIAGNRPRLIPVVIVGGLALILGGVGTALTVKSGHDAAAPGRVTPSIGHTIPAASPSNSAGGLPPAAAPNSSPALLTGKWSGHVSGDQSGFDVVATIIESPSLTATVSYPQLNCGGTWTQHGSAGNGVRFVTERITYGSCVTSEVTLAQQDDGTLYFTSSYYAESEHRIFNTRATLRRSTNG